MSIIKLINDKNIGNEKWVQKVIRYLIGILILLATYLVLTLLYIYPHWPIDISGWFILILLGIPISLILEWLGEIIFTKESGQKISNKTFSFKRLIIALVIFVSIIVTLSLLWFAYGSMLTKYFK